MRASRSSSVCVHEQRDTLPTRRVSGAPGLRRAGLAAVLLASACTTLPNVRAQESAPGAPLQPPFVVAPVARGALLRWLPWRAEPTDSARLAMDVAWLASPALGGRAPGTVEGARTATFLADRLARLALVPAFRAGCDGDDGGCGRSFHHLFAHPYGTGRNVGAFVPGSDPELRDEYVIVGAHYDHLGHSPEFAMDRQRGTLLRPGADDNASGTAVALALARRFAERPARRSVLVLFFDAEEMGLLGSSALVAESPVPIGAVRVMLNLDMVGRLSTGTFLADAAAHREDLRALADSAAARSGLRLAHAVTTLRRSDHASFEQVGIPALQLATGAHDDYHTAGDIAAKVDVRGLVRITDVAEWLLRAIADGTPRALASPRAAERAP